MFHFTIRELVLLTLVVTLGVRWRVDGREVRRQREVAIQTAEGFSRQVWEMKGQAQAAGPRKTGRSPILRANQTYVPGASGLARRSLAAPPGFLDSS